jgi:gliding motility-associated-like protein
MPGNYTLTLTDVNNCSGSVTVNIPQPLVYTLDLGPNQEIYLGDSILLSGQASFPIASVRWTPQLELSSPGSPETYVRPLNTTTYQLEAIDSIGCRTSASIRILVNKQNRIFIPNAFSPNGDNINDIFMVFSDASVQEVISMRIFDRWGNQLFESGAFLPNDPQFGWDGSFRGQSLDTGVFIYAIELLYIDGRTEIKKGDVMLMR